MAWREALSVSLRCEFCEAAVAAGANVSSLCRQYGISRKTGYKWLKVWHGVEADSASGRDADAARRVVMADRSRRPHTSPERTPDRVESVILAARDRHPVWGARKLLAWLGADESRRDGVSVLALPAASTATAILRRHGRITPEESDRHRAFQRFERAAPNDLWQMDFKGHFAAGASRCHPLTVLDDHSRYSIGIEACDNERCDTVQARLTHLFRNHGLPGQILCDNGPPWGDACQDGYTALEVWLMRLGVSVTHGRPRHPQTQGKDERFHRTLKAEVIERHRPQSLWDCQRRFSEWRQVYNHERPHQALDFATPASRYRPSDRAVPTRLPPIEYAAGDAVRKVQPNGCFTFEGRRCSLSKGFSGEPVALRSTGRDGEWAVYYCQTRIGTVDLRADEQL
jgi:transposase InsO family protein